MAYLRFEHDQKWGPRKGLEGPFHYPNGQVLYYDPTTDFYVPNEDVAELQQMIFQRLAS